jgi:hypothetical protein
MKFKVKKGKMVLGDKDGDSFRRGEMVNYLAKKPAKQTASSPSDALG